MKSEPVIVECIYNASLDKVWKAITKVDEMRKWFFDIPEFKLETGHEFSFYDGDGVQKYLHHCQVTDITKNKKLAYSWRYEEFPTDTLVTFELFHEENDKTRLKLTHMGVDDFPTDDREFARESFEQSWKHIIETTLKQYLENAPASQG